MSDYRSFIWQNLKVVGLLGKLDFFIPLRIQMEMSFSSVNTLKLESFEALKWYLNHKKSEAWSTNCNKLKIYCIEFIIVLYTGLHLDYLIVSHL